jgi:hypothetical protein
MTGELSLRARPAIQGVPMNGDSWIAAQGRNDKARIIER